MLLAFSVLVIVLLCLTFPDDIKSENSKVTPTRNKLLSNDWWEVRNKSTPLFSTLRESQIFIRSVEMDENHLHSCYEYKILNNDEVISHANSFCMPLIVVSGIRKCSTSALYNLMVQYPNTVRVSNKENCVLKHKSIVDYFVSLPTHIEKGQIFMDGCIEPSSNTFIRTLLRRPKTFYLVVTRDYADWIWSAYNYWCNDKYDGGCKKKTTEPGKSVRTPEILHDIVVKTIKGVKVETPMEVAPKPCELGENRYSKIMATTWAKFPLEDTLVLASEDLESNPVAVWMRIATAIGLSLEHPHLKEFGNVRYNAQIGGKNTTGFGKTVAAATFQPGLYEVSNFKPMLNETRDLLHKCWKNDCIFTSILTQHNYAACYKEAVKVNTYGSMLKYIDDTVKDKVFNSQMHTYLTDIQYRDTNQTNKYTNFIARITDNTCNNMFINDITTTAAVSNVVTDNILILTTSYEDATYLQQLLYYATLSKVSAYNTFNTNVNNTNNDNCTMNSDGGTVTITHPNNIIKLSNASTTNKQQFTLKSTVAISYISNSNSNSNNVTFQCTLPTSTKYNKVVIFSRDVLTSVWIAYLKKYDFYAGLSEDMLYRFNWNKWDTSAVPILDQIVRGVLVNTDSILTTNAVNGSVVKEIVKIDTDLPQLFWTHEHLHALFGSTTTDHNVSASNSVGAQSCTLLPRIHPESLQYNENDMSSHIGSYSLDTSVVNIPKTTSTMHSSSVVIVSREDIMYTEQRYSVLKQLLAYMTGGSDSSGKSDSTPGTVYDNMHTTEHTNHQRRSQQQSILMPTKQQLDCAYKQVSLSSVKARYDHLQMSKYLHIAYGNNNLICAIRDYLLRNGTKPSSYSGVNSGSSLFSYSPDYSLLNTYNNVTCIESVIVNKQQSVSSIKNITDKIDTSLSPPPTLPNVATTNNKCLIRYSDSTYRSKPTRSPVALIGMPGLEMSNVRLLFEHGTGIYTGSVVTNKALLKIFGTENDCTPTQSVVFLNANLGTLIKTISGTYNITVRIPTTGLSTNGASGVNFNGRAPQNIPLTNQQNQIKSKEVNTPPALMQQYNSKNGGLVKVNRPHGGLSDVRNTANQQANNGKQNNNPANNNYKNNKTVPQQHQKQQNNANKNMNNKAEKDDVLHSNRQLKIIPSAINNNNFRPATPPPPLSTTTSSDRTAVANIRAKCQDNNIRGFGKGIILTTDPFYTLYMEYVKTHAVNTSAIMTTTVSATVRKENAKQISKEFQSILNSLSVSQILNIPVELLQILTRNEQVTANQFRVVSYESLINPSTAAELGPNSRTGIFRNLVSFVDLVTPYQERLDCMHTFLNSIIPTQNNELLVTAYQQREDIVRDMNTFFNAHHDVVCSIHIAIDNLLMLGGKQRFKFKFYRLYTEVHC